MKRKKIISNKIKLILIRILLGIIKGFKFIIKSFFNLLKPLAWPLKKMLIILYKYVFLNSYKLVYFLNKIVRSIFPARQIKPIYLFVNKYIVHIIAVLMTFIICFTNLFISQTRAANYGEKSILFALANGSDLESDYVEETIQVAPPATTSYLGEGNGAVSPSIQALPEPNLNQIENDSLLSGEGSALLKPEFSSLTAAQAQRDKSLEYIVKDGDTLGSIATDFGLNMQTILWENKLTKTSLIRPGQKLVILPIDGVSHKVVAADNLDKIAKKYKADKNKIIEFNNLADARDIQVGQILIIPEGQAYFAPPASVPRLAPIQQIFTGPAYVETEPSEGKMLWPNGCRRITQYFNWRHTGVDIACPAGTPIRAADDGTVTVVKYLNTGYGHQVDIDHGGGKMTRYGHMTTIYVKPGQNVKRGEAIGLEGSTGRSTGPHLHFEVRFFNKVYNPLSYIK
ncbi:MAG: M23 family metallopeptidase [Patescibacteria group bacterium]